MEPEKIFYAVVPKRCANDMDDSVGKIVTQKCTDPDGTEEFYDMRITKIEKKNTGDCVEIKVYQEPVAISKMETTHTDH